MLNLPCNFNSYPTFKATPHSGLGLSRQAATFLCPLQFVSKALESSGYLEGHSITQQSEGFEPQRRKPPQMELFPRFLLTDRRPIPAPFPGSW